MTPNFRAHFVPKVQSLPTRDPGCQSVSACEERRSGGLNPFFWLSGYLLMGPQMRGPMYISIYIYIDIDI